MAVLFTLQKSMFISVLNTCAVLLLHKLLHQWHEIACGTAEVLQNHRDITQLVCEYPVSAILFAMEASLEASFSFWR